jgi:hypothetical protein
MGAPRHVEGWRDGRIVVEQFAPDQIAKQNGFHLARPLTFALQARGDDLVAEIGVQQPDRRSFESALCLRPPLLQNTVVLRGIRAVELDLRPPPQILAISC